VNPEVEGIDAQQRRDLIWGVHAFPAISDETYEEWNRETGGRKLPERMARKKLARKRPGAQEDGGQEEGPTVVRG
jgi:hypothetical protein